MILADTSAWVEYDRVTGSEVGERVRRLIESEGPLAVTEPVTMEVLAGARDERRESDLRRLLLRFQQLPFDSVADFEGAARIYRRCRAAGVTPRGLIDCTIATVAWREGATLLTSDRDLCRIAEVIGIDLDEASPHLPEADQVGRGLLEQIHARNEVSEEDATALVVEAQKAVRGQA